MRSRSHCSHFHSRKWYEICSLRNRCLKKSHRSIRSRARPHSILPCTLQGKQMPRLRRVPEPFREGLGYLISLDEAGFQELYNALHDAPPALYSSGYFDRLTPDGISVPGEQITEIIEALFSISMTYVASSISMDQFVEDVADALASGKTKNIELEPERRQQFVDRATALLKLDVFRIGAKATNLLLEQQTRLDSARMFTDARPIFDNDVSSPPVGVVVFHTLQIEYREGAASKTFYVAMDTTDVQILIDVLERAKTKAETIKSSFAATELRLIEFD